MALEAKRPVPMEIVKAKVCLVGDEGVGKTSLIHRFVYSMYDESYIRTVGTMVSKRDVDLDEAGYRVSLMVWDIMGRKDFMNLFKEAYFRHAGGIVAVLDLARPETLESLHHWIIGVKSSVAELPTVVLANKVDLASAVRVQDSDIARFCREHSCTWMKTSAKTGENVEKAFRDVASMVVGSF